METNTHTTDNKMKHEKENSSSLEHYSCPTNGCDLTRLYSVARRESLSHHPKMITVGVMVESDPGYLAASVPNRLFRELPIAAISSRLAP